MLKKLLQQKSQALSDQSVEAQAIQKMNSKDIAVIGLSLRFPQADTAERFWQNLRSGADCMQKLPYDRLEDLIRYLKVTGVPYDAKMLRAGEAGFLNGIDRFDYAFFRMSPKEASLMDPNQRLFLQTAWAAIEDAGYGGERLRGTRTGIYVGSSSEADYKRMVETIDGSDLSTAMMGNLNAMLPSRLSYLLDLRGPSLVVDTSCSSSLTAVHLACQALRNGECDQAIAGGVQVHVLPLRKGKVGIESSTFRTCTFDDDSDGTGAGEGVAAVLLKPLYRAKKDGDHIYAVIKGSAINQDGRSNGLTAPNAAAQEQVLVRSWRDAGIDPATITCLEAHGTGTKLGDPIEIDGIRRAFAAYTDRKQFCAIGSVKSNFGHLDNAAGIAGLIKAILALYHRELPPTLHFQRPNRKIPLENSPVYINDCLRDWESAGPRRCGVSSFGLSGTNCHVVLEEAPSPPSVPAAEGVQIITLSARSLQALRRAVTNLFDHLCAHEEIELADVCRTLNTGRTHWEHRLVFWAHTRSELLDKLEQALNSRESIEEILYGHCKPEETGEKREFDPARLHECCEQYVNGAAFDWELLHAKRGGRRVSLPSYAFEMTRCWLEIEEASEPLHYRAGWQAVSAVKGSVPIGASLLLHDGSQHATKLSHQMRDAGGRVIEVVTENAFSCGGTDVYTLGDGERAYQDLLQTLGDTEFNRVIDARNWRIEGEVATRSGLEEALEQGMYGFLELLKTLGQAERTNPLDIVILSAWAHPVTDGQNPVYAHHALSFGIGKTMRWEQPLLRCRSIDTDAVTPIEVLIEELRAEETPYGVAYRNGVRYVECLTTLELDDLSEETVEIHEGGVYVITGGLGKLGLEMAGFLASKAGVRLALLSRTADTADAQTRARIQSLEESGAEVLVLQADVADEVSLERALGCVRSRWGRICGVVHCAGVGVGMNGSPVVTDSRDTYTAVLWPKVQGTWQLEKAIRADRPDFLLLFSSVLTLVGSHGGGSYAAANSYLDSFAAQARLNACKVLTINWPYWQVSMPETPVDQDRELFRYLTPDVALTALSGIWSKRIDRAVIGILNKTSPVLRLSGQLPLEIEEGLRTWSLPESKPKQSSSTPRRSIKLSGKAQGDYTDQELDVASVWQEVLGFAEFGVHDNFFEIGGDSIHIIKVHAHLEERYPGRLQMTDLFAYPTIAKIAEQISGQFDLSGDRGEESLREQIRALLTAVEQGEKTLEETVRDYHRLEGNR
ncbi:phosphopantetheine binding protein [Brevibacillus sp. AG162]|nr:phosphopantetheine binding protein [Brevibacillus sp. AG162]